MSLLDRQIGLRSQSTGALARPSQAESQYKRQARNYERANRLLGRAARRGDVKAAMTQIGLQDQANDSGIDLGGIRSHQGDIANTAGDIRRKEFIAGRNESTAARFAGGGVTPQAVRDAPVTRFGDTTGEAEAPSSLTGLFDSTRTGVTPAPLAGSSEPPPVEMPVGSAAARLQGTSAGPLSNALSGVLDAERLSQRQTLDKELGQTLQAGGDTSTLGQRALDLGVSPEAFAAREEARKRALAAGNKGTPKANRLLGRA